MQALLRFLDRLVPSLLMACSVALLTVGLLSYAPSAFGDWQTPEPTFGGGDPLFTSPAPSATPTAGPDTFPPAASPTPVWIGPTPSATPTGGPETTPTPAPAARAYASRIVIPSLRIDLPVVAGNLDVPGNVGAYPLCDVAMYLVEYVQPGEAGTTYIYAHAQRGMFAPLLKASLVDDGAAMVGALIEVYTSDDKLHLYEIVQVKRHATDLSITNLAPGEQQLVLQTSEGVTGTVPKLQIAARPLSVVPASDADANPQPHPRVCLPASGAPPS
jgi:hypothetical protein